MTLVRLGYAAMSMIEAKRKDDALFALMTDLNQESGIRNSDPIKFADELP
ncbi:hypothetical protein [Domibacillus aminovorans]|nr:hypothetical protein [Domibacillus aminovorans]